MQKTAFILSFIIITSLFSSLVLAQGFFEQADVLATLSKFLKVPKEWLKPPDLIYNLILPFLAILVILLGFLKSIRIFYRAPNLQLLLAFIITFSTLPTELFYLFVSATMVWMGVGAYIAFIILFFLGLIYYTVFKVTGWERKRVRELKAHEKYEKIQKRYMQSVGSIRDELKGIKARIAEIDLQLMDPNISVHKHDSLVNEKDRLTYKRARLISQLRELERY